MRCSCTTEKNNLRRVCSFLRWTRRKNIAQNFLWPIDRITKYSSERFLSSRGQNMPKHFLSSVLLQRSDHCLKSYKSALIDGINNVRLMKAKKQTNIKCNIIIQAYRSRCSWWKPSSKVRIAKDFSTPLRIQQGEVLREAYYWKRWFPITFCQAAHLSTKNPIDEPAKNNKRILKAAVFHFADAVQKDG